VEVHYKFPSNHEFFFSTLNTFIGHYANICGNWDLYKVMSPSLIMFYVTPPINVCHCFLIPEIVDIPDEIAK